MKILLTGATGFIGSAFARLAVRRGHTIAGLIVPSETVPPGWPPGETAWLRGTLEDAPWREIEALQPDVCLHTAWVTTPGVYLESPENERYRDTSLEFLRRASLAGISHVVALGTCIEYEITCQPLSEERTAIRPTTTYARCKNELRLALEAEASRGRFNVCWARVFYPYGPGEHPSRLCSSIVGRLARDEKISLKTPDSTKDYIYIEDLASALLTVVEARVTGAVNLGTGIGVTVREIASRLGEMLGKGELISAEDPTGPDPFPCVVADASKLRKLGWGPAWTLERGLCELVKRLLPDRH